MKGFLTLLSVLMLLAIAIPAMADVDVYANIYKEKNVVVNETIQKDKYVFIDVDVIVDLETAEEAMAIVNQDNNHNTVDEDTVVKGDTIENSVFDNDGITLLNQSSGNMNNQSNVVSAAVGEDGFTEAQASVEQNNGAVNVENGDQPNDVTSNNVNRYDHITSSINSNTGITAVNQSCGNMNNQTNVVALAAGVNGSNVVLSEADLGQAVAANTVTETNVNKGDYIYDSINSNHGVTAVNQSSGNMNQQANVVSIAGTHP
jgi:hypothetical protein